MERLHSELRPMTRRDDRENETMHAALRELMLKRHDIDVGDFVSLASGIYIADADLSHPLDLEQVNRALPHNAVLKAYSTYEFAAHPIVFRLEVPRVYAFSWRRVGVALMGLASAAFGATAYLVARRLAERGRLFT